MATEHRVAAGLRVPTVCVLVDMGADSGPVAAEASHRHNTSTQVQDIFRQKEQAQQLGYRRMKQMFGQRWQSMDLQSRQPTHGLRKLSERMMACRRISEEVGSTASGWYTITARSEAAQLVAVQPAGSVPWLGRFSLVFWTASWPSVGLYDAAANQQRDVSV